ncbi:MAG: PAS domain S-box protein [Candidatus Auribacterota bacterium]
MKQLKNNYRFSILIVCALLLVCAIAYLKISSGISALDSTLKDSIYQKINSQEKTIEYLIKDIDYSVREILVYAGKYTDSINRLAGDTSFDELLSVHQRMNDYLAVYLLNSDGKCIVSTDKRFLEKNYSFRPYYQRAIKDMKNLYLAEGTVSKQLGLYYGLPVKKMNTDSPSGVLVVKVQPAVLTKFLSDNSSGDDLMFSALMTPEGILVTSTNSMRLASITTLNANSEARIASCRQFELDSISELGFSSISPVSWNYDSELIAERNGKEYLLIFRNIDRYGGLILLNCYPYNLVKSVASEVHNMIGTLALLFLFLIVFVVIMGIGMYRNDLEYKRLVSSYNTLLQTDGSGILILDTSGCCIHANQEACAILHSDAGELRGQPVSDILAPSFDIDKKDAFESVWEAHIRQSREIHIVQESGLEYYIQVDGIKLDSSTYLLILKNITDRKLAEKALMESEQQLKDILDFFPDPTFVVNSNREIVIWNKAIAELTGYPSEIMLGKGNYEYALPFHGKRTPCLIDTYFEKDLSYTQRYENYNQSGNYIGGEFVLKNAVGHKYLLLKISRLSDRHGNMIGAIETIRDISGIKENERRIRLYARRLKKMYTRLRNSQKYLVQSSKMMAIGTLANGVAHEFNNIFTVISGYLELVLKTSHDQFVTAALENIRQASMKARAITQSLLDFSCQRDGVRQMVDFRELIQKSILLWEKQFEQEGIRIEAALQSVPLIMCDPNRMMHVFFNLFSNAADAMRNSKERCLRITLLSSDQSDIFDRHIAGIHSSINGQRCIVVSIKDSGRGIPEKDLARIFDPFFTSKGVLAEGLVNTPGTGMGLAIVYGILRELGAEIHVNPGVNTGAEFIIILPLKLQSAELAV